MTTKGRYRSCAPADVSAVVRQARIGLGIPTHRFTSMRLKILQSYLDAKSPISAYGLPAILGLSTRSGMMGIYRALDFLEEVGAIHRIQLLGSFVVCRQWGRDHTPIMLICTACENVEEFVSDATIATLDDDVRAVRFQRRRATIELRGLCAACH